MPALAAELVGLQVGVLLAGGGDVSAFAAKSATSTIPIVFVMGGDPIKAGLVDTRELARIIHSGHPLDDHFTEYRASLIAKGATEKHANLASYRARRVACVAKIDRLTDLDRWGGCTRSAK